VTASRYRVRRIEKPWGFELVWAHTERYVGKILHIKRGAALSYQFHRRKDETIYLLRGILALDFAPNGGRRQRRRLAAGDGVRIRPGDRHRMTAVTACDVLEASTPELDDVVRLEDRYGRVNGGSSPERIRSVRARPTPIARRSRAGATVERRGRDSLPGATPIGARRRRRRAHGGEI
jgi:mannose-6-phosphate isomerase-like protein (cupin superfamily)